MRTVNLNMRPPACVKCNLVVRIVKNAVGVEMMTADGPYQYFHGDSWECPGCGTLILAGYSLRPLAEYHNRKHYELTVESDRQQSITIFQIWLNPTAKAKYEEQQREAEVVA